MRINNIILTYLTHYVCDDPKTKKLKLSLSPEAGEQLCMSKLMMSSSSLLLQTLSLSLVRIVLVVVVGSEHNLKGTWKSANLTWTCLIHGP